MKTQKLLTVWMTGESIYRLENGGNNKGAVPVHGKRSSAAIYPLYNQAYLDAAVLSEREECAVIAETAADRLQNSTFQGVSDAIRARK